MSDEHTTAMATVEPSGPPARMHPMVQAMMAHNPDVETLRELMQLQREWSADEARKAYAVALVNLKRDMPTVIDRDSTVAYGAGSNATRYTHASLGAAIAAVTPALASHGFALDWRPSNDKGAVTVTARLTHAGGHYEEVTLSSAPDNKGSKSGPQAIASTITLLERYTALALLGIATADMKDPAPANDEPVDPATHVDPGRNLAAAGEIKRRRRSMAEAMRLVGGRTVQQWTAADLDVLRAWLRPAKPAPSEVVTEPAPASIPAAEPSGSPGPGWDFDAETGEWIPPEDFAGEVA